MSIAKWLMFLGLGFFVLGVIIYLLSKLGIPFGKLPGDLFFNKGKWMISFPIATSIIVSIILTILLNLIFWFFRK